jgi:hypothetical protein
MLACRLSTATTRMYAPAYHFRTNRRFKKYPVSVLVRVRIFFSGEADLVILL